MSLVDPATKDQKLSAADVESALDPVEMEGTYRDTRECAALALQAGGGQALLSPPTPRPKKDKG
ncbi:hypothetical protein [Streptomyces syringium]|uniref:hypothetical protein n=1 Tax=Streptomyces syringium TaxID=76729 RepID=UPI003426EF41